MKQVTMVSLYGQKRGKLEKLIKECWKIINSSKFGIVFEPYHLHQIHGTIIGMEKLIGFSEFYNANRWRDSGNRDPMDYDQLLNVVSDSKYLPMTIRFGGFDKAYKQFMSFGKRPYERSFQIQWSTRKFVLIGWPHENGDFTNRTLWDFRNKLETRCNIRHKYAIGEDNDFFMVLGEIKGPWCLSESELTELEIEADFLEESIREYLWINPIDIEITSEQVFLAQYEKETLPPDSTNVYCIASYRDSIINSNFIQSLYF